jgi:O-antigen/teichoic acid export membrane protein
MGEYSTTLSWLLIAMPVAVWGFDQFLLRELSLNQNNFDRYLVNAGFVTVGSVAITAVLLGLMAFLFDYPASLSRLLWVSAVFVLPLYTGSLLLETAVKSLERMEWIAVVRFPLTLVRVGISIYLLSQGVRLEMVFLLLAIYYGATCLVYYRIIYNLRASFSWRLDAGLIRQLALHAVPFVLIGVFGMTFKQVDRIVLSALETMEELGIYAAGATMMGVVIRIAPAMMESLFPGLSRMHLSAPQRFPGMVARLLRMVWFITVPLTLVVITLAKPAILILFSLDYLASIRIAQILALAVIPAFLSRLLYRVVLASKNERTTLRIAALNSLFGVTLNLALIPLLGLVGAAIAAVGTEILGFFQNLQFVNRRVVPIPFWSTVGKPFVCALAGFVVYWLVGQWNEYVALLCALPVYTGLSFYLKVIATTDFLD